MLDGGETYFVDPIEGDQSGNMSCAQELTSVGSHPQNLLDDGVPISPTVTPSKAAPDDTDQPAVQMPETSTMKCPRNLQVVMFPSHQL